jgi:hypothetical protein
MRTMTHRLIHFTAAACAVLTLAGTAHAVDLRSWDRKFNDANDRFVVLPAFGNQAVLDKETQLVWQRSPNTGAVSFEAARGTCLVSQFGGRKGWRLPTGSELSSLIDPSISSAILPALPKGHPFTQVAAAPKRYWTSTRHSTEDRGLALALGSQVEFWFLLSSNNNFWCVRGSGPAE